MASRLAPATRAAASASPDVAIGVLNDQNSIYADHNIWATIPADQAFRPLGESTCPLVAKIN